MIAAALKNMISPTDGKREPNSLSHLDADLNPQLAERQGELVDNLMGMVKDQDITVPNNEIELVSWLREFVSELSEKDFGRLGFRKKRWAVGSVIGRKINEKEVANMILANGKGALNELQPNGINKAVAFQMQVFQAFRDRLIAELAQA